MTIFQYLILIIIAIVIAQAIQRLLKKEITIWLFLVWLFFWSGIAIIDIWPFIIDFFADFVGVGRGVDLILYFAIIILFYVIFKQSVKLNKQEKKISELVRKSAVEESLSKIINLPDGS